MLQMEKSVQDLYMREAPDPEEVSMETRGDMEAEEEKKREGETKDPS